MYEESQIKHETETFWVLEVGRRGFEVYRTGIAHSTRVAQIGRATAEAPNLGLPRAIEECNKRQRDIAAEQPRATATRAAVKYRKAREFGQCTLSMWKA